MKRKLGAWGVAALLVTTPMLSLGTAAATPSTARTLAAPSATTATGAVMATTADFVEVAQAQSASKMGAIVQKFVSKSGGTILASSTTHRQKLAPDVQVRANEFTGGVVAEQPMDKAAAGNKRITRQQSIDALHAVAPQLTAKQLEAATPQVLGGGDGYGTGTYYAFTTDCYSWSVGYAYSYFCAVFNKSPQSVGLDWHVAVQNYGSASVSGISGWGIRFPSYLQVRDTFPRGNQIQDWSPFGVDRDPGNGCYTDTIALTWGFGSYSQTGPSICGGHTGPIPPYTDSLGRVVGGAYVTYNPFGRGAGYANSLKCDIGVHSPAGQPFWPSYAQSHFGWNN